jgi:hypothetical protein
MTRFRAAFVAAALLAPITASAQVESYSRISFSASQMFDGNLFATPASGQPHADLISRFGPTLEVGYLSVPLEIAARYDIQAERYLEHPDLNDNVAHQDALLSFRYLPSSRFRANLDAAYVRTQTPGELNLVSQLGVGRRPAERAVMTAAVNYNWTDVMKLTATHTFGRDALVGGFASAAHDSRVAMQRRSGPRSTYQADYQFRSVDFDGGARVMSHAITAGGTYSIAPRTGVEIAVGPRFSERSVRPEVAATVRHQMPHGDLSIGYARTELTAIGERGMIDMHRVAATGKYRLGRRFTLAATPAFARSTREDRHVPVYSLDLESGFELTRQLSLTTAARLGRQDGTFAGTRDRITSRSLMLKVMMTLPRNASRDAGSDGVVKVP